MRLRRIFHRCEQQHIVLLRQRFQTAYGRLLGLAVQFFPRTLREFIEMRLRIGVIPFAQSHARGDVFQPQHARHARFRYAARIKAVDKHRHAGALAAGFVIVDYLHGMPIQKNNLTSLSRLAVLSVLSAARRLVSLLF